LISDSAQGACSLMTTASCSELMVPASSYIPKGGLGLGLGLRVRVRLGSGLIMTTASCRELMVPASSYQRGGVRARVRVRARALWVRITSLWVRVRVRALC
jgi:hypothetical protein